MITAVDAADTARFPGKPAFVRSPDGRYEIDSTDDYAKENHTLLLKKTGGGAAKEIHSYGRNVEVLWSPDSKRFAVNDNAGSNVAFALLFAANSPTRPVDLGAKLVRLVRQPRDRRSLTGNDSIYFNVRKWISPTELEIAASGHGKADPQGFTLVYRCDVSGFFRRMQRLQRETH